ncbi:DUF4166 domain-containing protein [Microbulbifer sp. A4B17]|uniref:DUF4166 domain-containing protein n=1 Tax=Microbulbifer sp. A4B17 TaxID=359370 RepID=UPI0013006B50|nr:DUF4166 domain-containing protein [Microbulbifer sp. A4B17]
MNILSAHMGSSFNELSPLLQFAHTGVKRYEGSVVVKRGGVIANTICSIFRFPKASSSSQLVVDCGHFSDRMDWVRDFDGFKMSSSFYSEKNYLVERLGPLEMQFTAHNVNGALEYQFSKTKLLGIALPKFLWPKVKAYETESEGRYQFSVSVHMFLVGFILSYAGDLKITEPA